MDTSSHLTRARTRWLSGAGLALAAAMANAAPAIAQDSEDETDVIVVEATRTNLSTFDYPGLASAIDLETLNAERPTDLADLLEDVPALQVAGGPRRTGQTLNLRGFSRENITLLVDGARQNFNSAHDGVLFLDPGLLRRVETVRGPASALYGSGASGGVISFETVEADDLLHGDETFGARLSAGYRSVNEETRGSAAIFAEGDAVEGVAAISLRSSGDIRLGSGNDLPADDEIFSSLVSVEFDPSDDLEIELGWLSFRNDAVEPNNGQNGLLVDGLNPLVEKEVQSDSLRASLDYDPDSDLIEVEATLFHNIGAVDEIDPAINRSITRDLTTIGVRAENRAEFELGEQEFALTVGGDWYEDEQEGGDSTGVNGQRGGVPNGTTTFYGAYLQLETEIDAGALGSFVLLPGVRFDHYESDSDVGGANEDDAVSPRFAVSWAPTEEFRLFGSWSEAFRAPSLNELYLSGLHFTIPHPVLGPAVFVRNDFLPNPGLRPESTETIEIGAAFSREGLFTANDRIEVKGAWYQTDATDLINLQVNFSFAPTCFAPPFFAPCDAGTAFSENLADAELEGFELAAVYENGPFSLTGSVFEVDGEDVTTGDPLGALQPLSGFLHARYELDSLRTDLGARISFASDFDRTADPALERDGFAVFDVHASWRPYENERIRIDFGVDNVFDEDYERVFAGVSEPGRSFRIDLTWSGGR
ncbi:MAG: TonB-dependent receptor [Pseudomonadota bacterium]